jgi:hypothetical protein
MLSPEFSDDNGVTVPQKADRDQYPRTPCQTSYPGGRLFRRTERDYRKGMPLLLQERKDRLRNLLILNGFLGIGPHKPLGSCAVLPSAQGPFLRVVSRSVDLFQRGFGLGTFTLAWCSPARFGHPRAIEA